MIINPDWLKPKAKPYFHQTKLSAAHVLLNCIEKLVECMESIDKEEMDCDTCFEMEEQILSEEIEAPNLCRIEPSELMRSF